MVEKTQPSLNYRVKTGVLLFCLYTSLEWKGLTRNAFQSSVPSIKTPQRTQSECRLSQFQAIIGFFGETQKCGHNQSFSRKLMRHLCSWCTPIWAAKGKSNTLLCGWLNLDLNLLGLDTGLLEKVILQLFSEGLQIHSRTWNGKWRRSVICYQRLHSSVLYHSLLPKVMLSTWKHRTQARSVRTFVALVLPVSS